MIDAKAFLKIPIPFLNICMVYPPSVKDILTEPAILDTVSLITTTQSKIDYSIEKANRKNHQEQDSNKKNPTPLEFLLINCYQNPSMFEVVQKGFKNLLHTDLTILYDEKIICLHSQEELIKLDVLTDLKAISEENYFDFQNAVRQAVGMKLQQVPPVDEDAISKRVRLAAERREIIKSSSKKGTSFDVTLAAICCMNLGITPLNIGEISYAAVTALLDMYQQKEEYEMNIRSLLAGADPKKVKPKYWIRDDSNLQEIKI